MHYLHHVNKMNTWWIDLICSSMFHVQNSDDFDEFWSQVSMQMLLNNKCCCQLYKFCVNPNLNVVKTWSITALNHEGKCDNRLREYCNICRGFLWCCTTPEGSFICVFIDWLTDLHLGSGPLSPDAPRPWFNGPFVPHIKSWKPHNLNLVPDGPQS